MLPKQVQGLEPSKQVVCLGAAEQMFRSLNSASVCSFNLLTHYNLQTTGKLKNLAVDINSIQPYSSIPFAWKDANLLVCTQDLMGSFSCSDAWKQLHCWDKHGVSNVLCVLAPNACKSGGVAFGCSMSGNEIWRVGDKWAAAFKEDWWSLPTSFYENRRNFWDSAGKFRKIYGQKSVGKGRNSAGNGRNYPGTPKSAKGYVVSEVDGKNLNGRNFLQNLSGIFFCPLKFQVFYSTLLQYSFWLEGCKSAPLISFVLNKTWWVLSPTAASPGSSCRSQHFPLQRGTAETKHGVSNVLSVLAPPNACKSGCVAWVALCLAGLGQIKMKSGRVGDKCLESGKGPGWKCTCKYLQPKNFLHKVSNFFRLHSGQKAKAF